MDFIVWTRIIGPLAVLIFVIYVVVSANRLDKIITQQKVDAKYHVKTPIVSTNIDPDIIDDSEGAYQSPEDAQKNDERLEVVNFSTELSSKPMPRPSLLNLSHQTFRDGIVLAEVLGRPKCLRGR